MKAAVDVILEYKTQSLASGDRVEIRGFGSFNIRHIAQRVSRNPKTGEKLISPPKYKTHFKPGKKLRVRVNNVS